MQQLSPNDAVFLSIETDELPAHVGGLSFLEPVAGHPFSYDAFVELTRERIALCDRFSWRLQEVPFGLDRPYWVRTPDFDVADHLSQIALPAPYSDEALAKLVGMLFERPLDRTRPLWEMILIEGLPGDRRVLLWKVHHCLMDGASGANLSELMYDLGPEPAARERNALVEEATAGDPVAPSELIARATRNAARLPIAQSRHLLRLVRDQLTRREEEAPATAPVAPFNGVVGMQRGVVWSSVSFDAVKRLKDTLGVTVNDIVLSITAGALRDYLKEHDRLPEASLVASVPCSLRKADDKRMGNQVSELAVRWSTDIADPIERVLRIHDDADHAKRRAKNGESLDMIKMMGDALLPGALQLMIRGASIAADKMPLPANAVVSNVPMTPFPLYCAGMKIAKAIPISLLAPTQGMNITVLTYCGEMHFGIVHDPELLPEPWSLAGRIEKNLQVLQQAVDEQIEGDPF